MTQVVKLKRHLKKGQVYRRADLEPYSTAVDRNLEQLVAEGTLEKLAHGLYYVPKKSVFGAVPPDEEMLVKTYLKDDRFLITSPNAYNSLGVGTTQLYNVRVVYNHKRHGEVTLGNRTFQFHVKHHFPKKVTPEFLLVDLVNNLDNLAEDKSEVLPKAMAKVYTMDVKKMKDAVDKFGTGKTKKLLNPLLTESPVAYAGGLPA
jgi:hypothetical protein